MLTLYIYIVKMKLSKERNKKICYPYKFQDMAEKFLPSDRKSLDYG